ncbi:recombinase family protein [Streptomyces geranii]|uniref:hypothetical protein n=1 Tax=Streptomyces geranii TaxID=2058923 RepID=UPI001E2BA18F|nr:hypothetical protein [Streptomyces geranii]
MPTPAGRNTGKPWRPGHPVPAAVDPDLPSADIRIGYALCSHLSQELDSQLDALSKHGIPRDKTFSEKIRTRVRVRPHRRKEPAVHRRSGQEDHRCGLRADRARQ